MCPCIESSEELWVRMVSVAGTQFHSDEKLCEVSDTLLFVWLRMRVSIRVKAKDQATLWLLLDRVLLDCASDRFRRKT